MATGKVKWFNNAKGYGFILPENGGEDLFAHYSSIQMDGYKTLKAGQDVEFDTLEGPKGYHAVNIRSGDVDEAALSEPSVVLPDELPDDLPETEASEAPEPTDAALAPRSIEAT